MVVTRRELCCAALASRYFAPDPIEERLGIFCMLGAAEASARPVLAAARAAGFRRVQIQFPWPRVDETYLRSLPRWLAAEGLRAEAVGAYVNCCQPSNVIMDCRAEDLPRALDLAGALGSRCLVAWTGGYGSDLMKTDPRNFQPAATDAIARFLETWAPQLEKRRLTLALETYITLACPDAGSLAALLRRLSGSVGAVLDPPNLTPIHRFPQRDQELRSIMGTLLDRVALVHLKDFRLAPSGTEYELPGPLEGQMNYPLFAELILQLPGGTPIIAEHLPPDRFAQARRKLLPLFRASLPR